MWRNSTKVILLGLITNVNGADKIFKKRKVQGAIRRGTLADHRAATPKNVCQ